MNAMDCQLEQYAKDFQVLVGLHRDLEQRYEDLRTSHRQLAGAGEVLRSMSPRTQAMCLVTNLQGDIVQATERARALFEPSGQKVNPIQFSVTLHHLPRLDALLKGLQSGCVDASANAVEILLNPASGILNGEIYVMRPLNADLGSTSLVYWFVQELSKREQSDFASDPIHARTSARRTWAIVFNPAGTAVAADAGFPNMVGLDEPNLAGVKLSEFRTLSNAHAKCGGDVLTTVQQTGQWQGEISHIGAHTLAFRQWMTVSAIRDTDGQTIAYVAQLVNREMMLMAERLLLDAHYHDPVTGLPNRKYFKEQVARRIAVARQAGEHVALLSIMLDRRQWIHDTHDSAVSDAVVMKMGERLLELTRGCDTLARADEDQFLLLLTGPHNDAELASFATQIIKALSEPVTIQHQVLEIGGSIGCALFPQDGVDLPTLTKNAESTMRLARKAGGNRYGLYRHSVQPPRAAPLPQRVDHLAINQCDIPTTNMELGV
jgi:diguanylate cyclase (GGDEF)-like protein